MINYVCHSLCNDLILIFLAVGSRKFIIIKRSFSFKPYSFKLFWTPSQTGGFLITKKSAAIKAAPIFHKATMSFIEKSTAFPEIITLSPMHSQYRIPVREEAWKAVMSGLFSLMLQYGAIIQCVEPVTGSSVIPYFGAIPAKRSHIPYPWLWHQRKLRPAWR